MTVINRKNVFLILALVIIFNIFFIDNYVYAEKGNRKKVIKIAGDNCHPPYEYEDDEGNYTGFNIDIMRAIAIEMGLEIELIPMKWTDAIEALDKGEIDVIQGMSKTYERHEKYLFTDYMIKNKQVIFVMKDTNFINNIEDLSGRKVAFQEGDINEGIVKKIPGVSMYPRSCQLDGIKALLSGQVDAFIGNKLTGLYNLQKLKSSNVVKAVGEPLGQVEYCSVALKENSWIIDLLNEGLKEIKVNGTYDKIYRKWFGEEFVYGKMIMKYYAKEIIIIALTIIIIFILVLIWNKKLKIEVDKRTEELSNANRELLLQQAKIHDLAYYDSITSLPNKFYFYESLKNTIEKLEDSSGTLAVLCLNLDRFRHINDALGHNIGDMILKESSKRVKSLMGTEDFLANSGGDEFLLIRKNSGAIDNVIKFAERIIEEFQKPIFVENYEFYRTISIGISIYPEDGKDYKTLVNNSKMAMYKAKSSGRNAYCIYTKDLDSQELENLVLTNELRSAIDNEEFELYYQPKVNIYTEEVVGMEALIRWKHPERGIIAPNKFIPLAEEIGLIIPIGNWVLREACRQNKEWIDKGYEPRRLFVNISAKQFLRKDFKNTVFNILKETGLPPKYLGFEITETTVIADTKYAMNSLSDFKKLGINISIDDFGTGYSNLNYLKDMSVDELKIDRTFTKDIIVNSKNEKIIKTIIQLGSQLDLKVIVEGVETEKQIDFLKENGCIFAQGFFYSEPIPAVELEKLL